jgi:hypothetical protein
LQALQKAVQHRYGNDLAALAEVWPTLPFNIRGAILALARLQT